MPAQIVYWILLVFVFIQFISNLTENIQIEYVTQMVDPIKGMTLSYYSKTGLYLMFLYPIIVVFPSCTIWISDKGSGIITYFATRSGRKQFLFSKLTAVFLSTFVIFTLPFFIELFLNVICFDPSSKGDPTGFSFITTLPGERRYFLSELWGTNRYLYAFVMILLWGGTSGILASYNFAMTTLPFMRFRILTFFPVFILLYAGELVQSAFQTQTVLDYLSLFRMFFYHESKNRNDILYTGVMMVLLLVSVVIIAFQSRRDQLS